MQVVKRTLAEEQSILGGIKAQRAYPAALRMNQGPNRKEGPTAFAEKRAPNWVPPVPLAKL